MSIKSITFHFLMFSRKTSQLWFSWCPQVTDPFYCSNVLTDINICSNEFLNSDFQKDWEIDNTLPTMWNKEIWLDLYFIIFGAYWPGYTVDIYNCITGVFIHTHTHTHTHTHIYIRRVEERKHKSCPFYKYIIIKYLQIWL